MKPLRQSALRSVPTEGAKVSTQGNRGLSCHGDACEEGCLRYRVVNSLGLIVDNHGNAANWCKVCHKARVARRIMASSGGRGSKQRLARDVLAMPVSVGK
jgi:hypothetical protein